MLTGFRWRKINLTRNEAYIYPDLYGQPEEKGISHLLFPKDKREELARAAHK